MMLSVIARMEELPIIATSSVVPRCGQCGAPNAGVFPSVAHDPTGLASEAEYVWALDRPSYWIRDGENVLRVQIVRQRWDGGSSRVAGGRRCLVVGLWKIVHEYHRLVPFGAPLRALVQSDRTPKRVFVLGVYASAVHARWYDRDGKLLVRALAIASEPSIFWDGSGADAIVRAITVSEAAGRLEPAAEEFNGPSGRSIDDDFLRPLGLHRGDAWLCDLVPHTCLNPKQHAAILRAYVPRVAAFGLPSVSLPPVPKRFADDERRAELLAEVVEAQPTVIVVLGDQPIRHWLRFYDRRWRRLADFGDDANTYGRLHDTTIQGRRYSVLPLAHPRQVSGLGSHSPKWRGQHEGWKRDVAAHLLR